MSLDLNSCSIAIPRQLFYTGEAIGMQTAGAQSNQHIAHLYLLAINELVLLDRTHSKASHIVLH